MARKRKWFLTINPEANCYEALESILKGITGPEDFYAYILHDQDTNELGEAKKAHYHVVLNFKNNREFGTIQNKFPGAHIEEPINFTNAVQYLIHKNDSTKAQYDQTLIHSNKPELVESYIGKGDKEPFDPERIVDYFSEGTKSYLQFYMRFGAQIQPWTRLIQELLKELLSCDLLAKGEERELPF